MKRADKISFALMGGLIGWGIGFAALIYHLIRSFM